MNKRKGTRWLPAGALFTVAALSTVSIGSHGLENGPDVFSSFGALSGDGLSGYGSLGEAVNHSEGVEGGGLVLRAGFLTTLGGGAILPAPNPQPIARTVLAGNFPNPFSASTAIRYSLAEDGPVALTVYDVRGRQIRVLQDGPLVAGEYEHRWDGTSDAGDRVASGIYFASLKTPAGQQNRKMVLTGF